MEPDHHYNILQATKVPSSMGGTVHFYLNEGVSNSTHIYKIILPYEYGDVITPEGVEGIKSGRINLKTVYRSVNKYGLTC
jgi:hypothetical protein